MYTDTSHITCKGESCININLFFCSFTASFLNSVFRRHVFRRVNILQDESQDSGGVLPCALLETWLDFLLADLGFISDLGIFNFITGARAL